MPDTQAASQTPNTEMKTACLCIQAFTPTTWSPSSRRTCPRQSAVSALPSSLYTHLPRKMMPNSGPRRPTWCPPPPTIPLTSSNLPHHHHHPLHAPFTLPSAVTGKLEPLTWRLGAVSRAASRPELPGESQGRGSLVGCRLRGRTESDMTEVT